MMVAFDHIGDADRGAGVARDREADGVGSVALRKARTASARIAEIAERPEHGLVGWSGTLRDGAADARPGVAERQHRVMRSSGADPRFDGIEIGARHFGGIVAQGMNSSRLEALKSMVAQSPGDSFLRYGLAMEYRNGGDLEGAVSEFRAIMEANPDYGPAYFHGGQTLERLGRLDEAREWYRSGVEATRRKGDQHALSEMQAALDMLG